MIVFNASKVRYTMALFPEILFDIGRDTEDNFEFDDDVGWLKEPISPNIYQLKIYYPLNHYPKWYLASYPRRPILYSIVEYQTNLPITPMQIFESIYIFYQTEVDPIQFKRYQDYLWNFNPDEEAEEPDEPIYLYLLSPGLSPVITGLIPHLDGYTLAFD